MRAKGAIIALPTIGDQLSTTHAHRADVSVKSRPAILKSKTPACRAQFRDFPTAFVSISLSRPDLVFFSGDQSGQWGIRNRLRRADEDVPRAALNYLGKFWYLGVGFRDLRGPPGNDSRRPRRLFQQPMGQVWHPDARRWKTNTMRCWRIPDASALGEIVEQTQMGHHPDPYDDTP